MFKFLWVAYYLLIITYRVLYIPYTFYYAALNFNPLDISEFMLTLVHVFMLLPSVIVHLFFLTSINQVVTHMNYRFTFGTSAGETS